MTHRPSIAIRAERDDNATETWQDSGSSGSDDEVSYLEDSSDDEDDDDDDAYEDDSSDSDDTSVYFPGDDELSDFDVLDWLHRLTSCDSTTPRVTPEVQLAVEFCYNNDALEMIRNKNLYVWQLIEAIG